MAKSTSWTEAEDIIVTFRFNQRELLPTEEDEPSIEGFRPIRMIIDIKSKTEDGGVKDKQYTIPAGNVQQNKATLQQLATLIKGSGNSTGNFIVTELSKALNDSIGTTVN